MTMNYIFKGIFLNGVSVRCSPSQYITEIFGVIRNIYGKYHVEVSVIPCFNMLKKQYTDLHICFSLSDYKY